MKKISPIEKDCAETFTRAAEMIAHDESLLACFAIADASSSGFDGYLICSEFFSSKMKPQGACRARWYGDFTPQNQMARSLGLLLCAEIIKDGGLR